MRYIVFDLDETLAEMLPMYYFIASLRLLIDEDRSHLLYIPASFHQSLHNAYRFFVHDVLKAEQGTTPLGLLRPGILAVMKRLLKLQEEGAIQGVMIYSNNSNLRLLEFIADVIHEHVRSKKLIGACVHLHHPLRHAEQAQDPHRYPKTWEGVKNCLVKMMGAPPSLSPEDVYFFDDMDHPDLQRALGDQYIQVPPYRVHAPFSRLADLYHRALSDAQVDESLFVSLVVDLLHLRIPRYITEDPTVDDLIHWFRLDTREESSTVENEKPIRGKEEGIRKMWEVIHRIRPTSLELQGGRRVRKGASTRKLRRRTIRK